jgi:hypothetical protein
MKELLDALDALLRIITTQAHSKMSHTLKSADHIRERLRQRNRRAQDRARRFRERSEKTLREAHDRALNRVEVARKRAKELHARLGFEAQTVMKNMQKHLDARRVGRRGGGSNAAGRACPGRCRTRTPC